MHVHQPQPSNVNALPSKSLQHVCCFLVGFLAVAVVCALTLGEVGHSGTATNINFFDQLGQVGSPLKLFAPAQRHTHSSVHMHVARHACRLCAIAAASPSWAFLSFAQQTLHLSKHMHHLVRHHRKALKNLKFSRMLIALSQAQGVRTR